MNISKERILDELSVYLECKQYYAEIGDDYDTIEYESFALVGVQYAYDRISNLTDDDLEKFCPMDIFKQIIVDVHWWSREYIKKNPNDKHNPYDYMEEILTNIFDAIIAEEANEI